MCDFCNFTNRGKSRPETRIGAGSAPALSFAAGSRYLPPCEPPALKTGSAGVGSTGETLQQEGLPESVGAVPQRIADACWWAAQHGLTGAPKACAQRWVVKSGTPAKTSKTASATTLDKRPIGIEDTPPATRKMRSR